MQVRHGAGVGLYRTATGGLARAATYHGTVRRRSAGGWLLVVVLWPALAHAQEAALPTVPDSPTCHQQLLQAQLQAEENPQGAIRLLASAMQTPQALVPVDADALTFRPVRWHVAFLLQQNKELRRVWQEAMGPRAERTLELEGPEATWDAWPATRAAVRAGLLLTRELIARGAPEAARWRLKTVRDDPAFGEGDNLDAANRLAAMLDRHAAAPKFSRASQGAGQPLDSIEVLDPSVLPARPSWSVPLPDAPLTRIRRATEDRGEPATIADERASRGLYRSVLPAVSEGTALVCAGTTLTAFDALTHMRRWSIGMSSQSADPNAAPLSFPTVRHGVAFAIVGTPQQPTRPSVLVAVPVESGVRRWSHILDAPMLLGEDAVVSDGVGGIVATDDVIVLQTRRVDARGQASAEVQCRDASHGGLRWTRLLGTAPQVGAGTRQATQLVEYEGTLLVPTTVGTFARIEVETGNIVWLTRMANPLRPKEGNRRPFDVVTTAVVDRGWVVLSPDERILARLALDTGSIERELPTGPGTVSGDVRYLLPGADGPVAVGEGVVGLDVDLDASRWRRNDLSPSGRVARVLVGDREAMLVPTADAVEVIACDNGETLTHWSASPCNPAVGAAGVVAATDDSLLAWVPTVGAIDRLTQALNANPGHLAAACALLDLGLQARDRALIARGCEAVAVAVSEAIQADPNGPFDELLHALRRASQAPETPPEAFTRAVRAAQAIGAPIRLAVLARFCEAAWMEGQGQERAAAEALWSVVTDPRAEELLLEDEATPGGSGRTVRAPVLAASRMARLAAAQSVPWPLATTPAQQEWITRMQAFAAAVKSVGTAPSAAAYLQELAAGAPVDAPTPQQFASGLQASRVVQGATLVVTQSEVEAGSTAPSVGVTARTGVSGALADLALAWRPGSLEAYSISSGGRLWAIADRAVERPQLYACAGRLLLITGTQIRLLHPESGAVLAACDDVALLSPLKARGALTVIQGRPRIQAVATVDDLVLMAMGNTLLALERDGTAFRERWLMTEVGGTIHSMIASSHGVWAIVGVQPSAPATAESGVELGVRLIDPQAGSIRAAIDGLPWAISRSATLLNASSILLRTPEATICVRAWGDRLHADWSLTGATLAKGVPSAIVLGDLLLPASSTGATRWSFDGTPVELASSAALDDGALNQWIKEEWGVVRWSRNGIWAIANTGAVIGSAVIPPGQAVRGVGVSAGTVVALLSESTEPGTLPESSSQWLGVFELTSGLRWASPPIELPEPDPRLVVGPLSVSGRGVVIRTNGAQWLVGPVDKARDG